MLNEQKNAFLSLEQENKSLQRDLAQVGMQIVSLEEQVFTLNNTLWEMAKATATDKTALDEATLPDESDLIRLVRENVCLHAKLGYATEAFAQIEEMLLHLNDVLEQY